MYDNEFYALCNAIHPDLELAMRQVFVPSGWVVESLEREAESREYGACRFKLNGRSVLFRAAHVTPTKVGQFVTLWKRSGVGPIEPYASADEVDLVVISVRSGERLGHFVFPKAVLMAQKIFASVGVEGKRALRVYPPWDVPTSSQAMKSQEWQCRYFIELSGREALCERGKKLYAATS